MMARARNWWRSSSLRVLREPVVHFFAIGAALFLIHRLVQGDPRTITVSPGVKAELARRFQDLNGRKPDPTELATELRKWERDEALFREAQRERLDRDDPSVRAALIDKMLIRAALQIPKREASDAELESWLDSHRSLYEAPLRYDFEFLAFPKSEPHAREQLDKVQRAIEQGASGATFGRPVVGGTLTAADMKDRIDPELSARIPTLSKAQWQRIETHENFFLARLKAVEGGLPPLSQVRARVLADWSFATRRAAVERIVQRTVERYHFEQP